MKKIYSMLHGLGYCVLSLLMIACYGDFLEIEPNRKLAVPTTLKDLDALMDNTTLLNANALLIMGEIGTDDYYLNETDWNSLTNPYQKNGYVWAKDIYEGQQCPGWNNAYQKILYANLVLESITKLEPSTKNEVQWNRIKGTALFWRAWQFFQLAQIFCDDYEKQTANQKMGIPVRLTSDINQQNTRATIEDTYRQIVQDLTEAGDLLPALAEEKTRPSKQAVYALLARTYLQMKEYTLAKQQAEKCLSISDVLISYSEVNCSLNFPFPLYARGNTEQPLLDAMIRTQTFASFLKIDTTLLGSYGAGDLRAATYFSVSNGYYVFKGTYNGYATYNPFPALDEVYLIRAECNERLGNHEDALKDLNQLLIHRYQKGAYQPKTMENTKNILTEILNERRKSLIFRGVRWSDLRRLRTETAYAKTIVRVLGNKRYELSPEQEHLYTWPIPDNVINLGGITQNAR
ncbi:RagB/SusD family nutrient uptake outer membrane protein [Arcicella sp. DC2W]|uniref:RagB/SusD family nutrient uptake outer membrane protein n=1 Tax=Arcicella gelida TaxID=2984195 RepID=A0ABU5S363_9BACT|nr:RagB/SusD family nutrient uptake outer membrane protein [Arcicella sp. DC2W]MEA5402830.1 RagB/SusD family nutrient uptake outer membrane protein [Arcicella sp. DC2W]